MKTTMSISHTFEKNLWTRFLLTCGIISSLLYVAMNVFIPMQFEGYSYVSQAVSELSAIGAPTRSIWVPFGALYIILLAGFGWGILRIAQQNRALHLVGMLMVAYAVFNIYWPPMHLRGAEPTITDALHIAWSIITVALMIVMMITGAASLGRNFRIYTITTLVLYVIFGFLTGLEAPNLAKNLPTPMLGVWERILIGLFLIWVSVLAVLLLKNEKESEMR